MAPTPNVAYQKKSPASPNHSLIETAVNATNPDVHRLAAAHIVMPAALSLMAKFSLAHKNVNGPTPTEKDAIMAHNNITTITGDQDCANVIPIINVVNASKNEDAIKRGRRPMLSTSRIATSSGISLLNPTAILPRSRFSGDSKPARARKSAL
eukprot:CAMPEP_0197723150 /NCGR_PEP_ID=MMETSP1434-20131217/5573_1 /TAXON_ID=265543 /ORGANISM="Minutocellus polymorphus, Strain CCMP3303" /LENGTH=152 /DNA_ID=CAMNT_0043308375 /DNA_START=107 /DNA_END=565 /DNA_ORIENTATION=+